MAELLIINIPGDTGPIDRGELYEDPLDKALRKAGKLGRVTGGGSLVDPKKGITHCDIEVEVTNLENALPVIRDSLRACKAPAGTTVTHEGSDKVRLKFTKTGVNEYAAGKPKKRYQDTCPWTIGEVLALKISPKAYVLLHLYGHCGGIVVQVPEWCGESIPDAAEIERIVKTRPQRVVLKDPICAFTLNADDRDDARIVRTGVTLPVPKKKQKELLMCLSMEYWPNFVKLLKKFFGLVKATRGEQLYADLGFGLESVHFALWTPETKATPADAVRLFYAFGSGWFRKVHPDRIKPPVTEALKACIADLKRVFQGQDVWVGNFAAKEGFVMIPVPRPVYKKVLPVIAKLAKQHGVTLYDSETDRLQPV